MCKNIKLYSLLLTLTFVTSLVAQPVFTNQTQKYKADFPTRSTYSGAMLDMDGDLVDDLIVLDQGVVVKWYKSKGIRFGFELVDTLLLPGIRKSSLTAGDLDNDGKNEIIVAGNNDNIQIIKVVNGKLTFQTIKAKFYAQASNTVDVNNDGWLDYFLCDDDGFNKLYVNNNSGGLILSNYIDLIQGDNSDGSGNYGSAWVDINGDMKPDLAVSKCRAGVNDPKDLRRINKLYVTDSTGNYTEKGKEFKFDSGAQSWVSLFGDIDNDGDLDAYVVNHYAQHQLLENIENTGFKEIPMTNPILANALHGVMRDFDNDGWLDIILIGLDAPLLLHNNGDKTFTTIKNFVGLSKFNSMTIGDLNDDGFIDFYGHTFNLQNGRAAEIDELLLNTANNNRYLKVTLKGIKSNASGIGAKLVLHTPDATYMRYVQAGESYSTFFSYQQHFGLGSSTEIDSLIITWPSGQIDRFYNINTNATYFAQEGKCISQQLPIYHQPTYYYNKSVELQAPNGFYSYLWSNGDTTKTITVDRPSTHHLTMVDSLGCEHISKPINVVNGCFSESDSLINVGPVVLNCSSENIILSAIDAQSYLWSNGATSQSIEVVKEGVYIVNIKDRCDQEFVRKVVVLQSELSFDTQGDSIQKGANALLTSSIPNTRWFSDEDTLKLLYIGKEFKTPSLDITTTYLAQGFTKIEIKSTHTGEKEFPMSNLYSSNNVNGDLIIEVINPVVIKSLEVNTDLAGERKIIITTSEGIKVFEQTINLGLGIQNLTLNVNLTSPGRYKLSTDEGTNIKNFGFKSPRLVRTQVNTTAYPYVVGDDFKILSTSSGSLVYYYFYDIEVGYEFMECNSDLKEVTAFVKKSVNTQDILKSFQLKTIPNPIINSFRIESNITILDLKLFNPQGAEVLKIDSNRAEIDISNLPSGFYILEVNSSSGKFFKKIIKN